MLIEKLKDKFRIHKTVNNIGNKTRDDKRDLLKLFLSLIVIICLVSFFEEFIPVIILGRALLTVFSMVLLIIYLYLFQPKIFHSDKDLLVIGMILLVSIGLIKLLFLFDIILYLIPVSMISILLSILINPVVSVIISGISGILIGIMIKSNWSYFIFILLSNWTAILCVSHLKRRMSLPLAGLFLGLGNGVLVFIIQLINNPVHILNIWEKAGWGFLGGILAVSLTSIFVPVLEHIFNLTTDIRLIELTDLNHTLLKNLALVAPGTYHHSIVVGNLAETAAEAIGANSLLARASSYFHDIGKIGKAKYFYENNPGNIHDNLTPSMSSLILISHVKDGIDLAHQYRLSEGIVNIIGEHHGTSLVSFFYQQAVKELPEEKISELTYRYPGPKPRSKEAGIVMLADIIEAASRTLVNPNPSRIRAMIERLVNERLEDHQLDECELTLEDITAIMEVFERVLTGIYHSRIDYPREDEIPPYESRPSYRKQ